MGEAMQRRRQGTILPVVLIGLAACAGCGGGNAGNNGGGNAGNSGGAVPPSAGMIHGAHQVLATESGTIDACLGRWGLQGKGALSVTQGEAVKVTGVMKNLKERQVFVTRTVKARGQVYQIRDKYGIPFSPQSRDRASEQAVPKQESL